MTKAASNGEMSSSAGSHLVDPGGDPQLHDLVPFVVGDRTFAVFVEHVEGTTEGKTPAVLPHAPAAVLGVIYARGHMLTVLDPVAIVTGEAHVWSEVLPCVIVLRGDEQLALAADASRDAVTVAGADIERIEHESEEPTGAILGVATYAGEEITVLNVDQLFAAVIRRKERRRRRF